MQAVKNGDRATALALARDAAEVAATEADGTTALHWAVRQNDLELVDRMLRTGADVNAANRYGVTPLKLAAVNGDAKLLETPARRRRRRERRRHGRRDAADDGGARRPRRRGARCSSSAAPKSTRASSWHGQTALMWAAAQGHPAMLRELLAHGADVNARSNHEEWERQVTSEPRDKWLPPGGLTPLLFAARENCLACLPVLIEAGADVNATTPDGISAVVIALINGHFDVAGRSARSGNRSESRRLHGPHGALRGHRLQHDGEVEPPGAEGASRTA